MLCLNLFFPFSAFLSPFSCPFCISFFFNFSMYCWIWLRQVLKNWQRSPEITCYSSNKMSLLRFFSSHKYEFYRYISRSLTAIFSSSLSQRKRNHTARRASDRGKKAKLIPKTEFVWAVVPLAPEMWLPGTPSHTRTHAHTPEVCSAGACDSQSTPSLFRKKTPPHLPVMSNFRSK